MRLKSWPDALQSAIDTHRDLPFEYGLSDCFRLPMDCVLAMTGSDPLAHLRGYENEIGAAKVLRRHGHETVGDAFASAFEEIPVMMMGRGDIAVVARDGAVGGCVCAGDILIGKAQYIGLVVLPRALASRAFKVG
ncbi:hypothetical protein X566_20180 [Afipia sp. P52-10]|uniref:DUF6950 family protein n=1 Tax=Afipia sp. P52-10 TaxID=1429916 RepID=UPI0003DF125F|nr:hypothetical protein [Afipia sp. P52-10]ETR75072.1 hypothetical protein X566_20180 [Afipia sp. P52-10]